MKENNQTPNPYVSSADQDQLIASGGDVLDLLATSGFMLSNKLLLEQAHLSPDFFDLSTGLAGEIFLKLTNYRVKTAVVINLTTIPSPRFHELVYECNKGREINFFEDRATAEKWLIG